MIFLWFVFLMAGAFFLVLGTHVLDDDKYRGVPDRVACGLLILFAGAFTMIVSFWQMVEINA
jgi:hypothetical protein